MRRITRAVAILAFGATIAFLIYKDAEAAHAIPEPGAHYHYDTGHWTV